MSATGPASPPLLRTLQSGHTGGGRKGGNELLVFGGPDGPALLKHYQRRGSRSREWLRAISYRFFERRRGLTAAQRCHVERENLTLWRRHGFDVPALLDRPLPEGFDAETALWLEYCPGPTLMRYLGDPGVPLADREREAERFAAALARRQRLALESGDTGLVMNHASLKHVLMHGDRQVSFDLEGAHARSTPILDALADELAGVLRSLPRGDDAAREQLGAAFLRGYDDHALLARIARRGLESPSLLRAVKRLADRRRGRFSKRAVLAWADEKLTESARTAQGSPACGTSTRQTSMRAARSSRH